MKLNKSYCKTFWMAALAVGMFATPSMAQSKKAPILSADTSLNTKYNEIKPVVSPDGSKMYFGRSNHPTSAGGRKDRADVWMATVTSGDMFGNVQRLASLSNSTQQDIVVGFTADGSQLYLMRNDPESANKVNAGLFKVSADGSGTPQAVPVGYFYNKARHQDITISADGQTMLLSLESYSTFGLEDLYVSTRQADGRWSEPQNLGADINSPSQEMSAFLAVDGRTLYFTSNRKGGLGSMDIWVSTRLDNSWKRWSKPQNMGSSINTAGADMYYYEPEAGEWGYFTSTQNSEGFGDIRRVRKPIPPVAPALVETPASVVAATEPAVDTTSAPLVVSTPEPVLTSSTPAIPQDTVVVEEVKEEVPVATTVTLRGQVTGGDGKSPLAKVVVRNSDYLDSVSAASSYSLALPAAGQYQIRAKAKGYLAVDTVVTISDATTQLNFRLRPLAVGTTMRIENVMFQQSTAVLISESGASLDKMVQMLKDNPSMEIMLTGHTDNQGSSRANIKLSQERVEAVKSYLVSRGIDPDRIQGKGFGGTRPVASNANEDTRQMNRRVEFTILKE